MVGVNPRRTTVVADACECAQQARQAGEVGRRLRGLWVAQPPRHIARQRRVRHLRLNAATGGFRAGMAGIKGGACKTPVSALGLRSRSSLSPPAPSEPSACRRAATVGPGCCTTPAKSAMNTNALSEQRQRRLRDRSASGRSSKGGSKR